MDVDDVDMTKEEDGVTTQPQQGLGAQANVDVPMTADSPEEIEMSNVEGDLQPGDDPSPVSISQDGGDAKSAGVPKPLVDIKEQRDPQTQDGALPASDPEADIDETIHQLEAMGMENDEVRPKPDPAPLEDEGDGDERNTDSPPRAGHDSSAGADEEPEERGPARPLATYTGASQDREDQVPYVGPDRQSDQVGEENDDPEGDDL